MVGWIELDCLLWLAIQNFGGLLGIMMLTLLSFQCDLYGFNLYFYLFIYFFLHLQTVKPLSVRISYKTGSKKMFPKNIKFIKCPSSYCNKS